MANSSPSFFDNLFANSVVGSAVNKPVNRKAEEIRQLSTFLGNEFTRIESTANLFGDSFINRGLKGMVENRTGNDLVKNMSILDDNIRIVDDKVKILDRNLRTNAALLEYNKKLLNQTNTLIEKWVKEGNYSKFSAIEDKMENGLLSRPRNLDELVEQKVQQMLNGSMSMNFSGGGGGGSPLGGILGNAASAAGGAIANGAKGLGGAAIRALPAMGAGLFTLLRKSMPVAAASGLAYIIAHPDGQKKLAEFAAYLDKRKDEIIAERTAEAAQAKLEEERRKLATDLGANSKVTITDLPPLPGTTPPAPRAVPLTLFDRYKNQAPKDDPRLDLNYDGEMQVPAPVTNAPGASRLPSLPGLDLDYNGEMQMPTPVQPGSGSSMLPPLNTVAPSLDLSSLERNEPFRVNVASLGNGLEGLSTDQLNNLFGRNVTVSPRFDDNMYERNVMAEKAAAAEQTLENYIKKVDLYSIAAKNFDVMSTNADFDIADKFEINAANIVIKAKQRLVLSAPIIEIAGKIVRSKEPVSDSYSPSNGTGGPSVQNASGLGNDIGVGAGTFSPGLPLLGNNPGSSGSGFGNATAPQGVVPMGMSGKDESRLEATGPDGKPVQPSDGSRKAQAFRYFKSKGYSDVHAAAIVGNLMAESGHDLSMTARGDGGAAMGIAQWNINGSPDRFANFKKLYGVDLWDGTFEQQLEFIDWELNNSEKRAGDRLRATTNVADAASVVDQYYERSSGEHRQARIENAVGLIGNAGDMVAGTSQGLPPGVVSGPTGVGDLDTIPEEHLDTPIKTSKGTQTLAELGITKYSELQQMGGQAFAGGSNDPNVTFGLGYIQDKLGPNFGRITAQNDAYHVQNAPNSRHTLGVKGDFTVQGISYAQGHEMTSAALAELGLVEGRDFKIISTPHGTGPHIDIEFTETGRSAIEAVRTQQVTANQVDSPVAQKGNRGGVASNPLSPRQDTGQMPSNPTNQIGAVLETVNKPPIQQTNPAPPRPDVPPPAPKPNYTKNSHDGMMLSARNLLQYTDSKIA